MNYMKFTYETLAKEHKPKVLICLKFTVPTRKSKRMTKRMWIPKRGYFCQEDEEECDVSIAKVPLEKLTEVTFVDTVEEE